MSVRIGCIAVGGAGVRFGRPGLQKCLTPVEEKPILEHCVDAFALNGVSLVFLLTGHLHQQISDYLAERSRQGQDDTVVVAAVYGGLEGVIAAIRKLRPFINEDFLYASGDIICPAGMVRSLIMKADKNQESPAALALTPHVGIAPKHPRLSVDRSGNRIVSIAITDDEMQLNTKARYSWTGLCYFRATAFALFERVSPSCTPSDLIRYALSNNVPLLASITKNPWFCLHTQQDIKRWSRSDMRRFFIKNSPLYK